MKLEGACLVENMVKPGPTFIFATKIDLRIALVLLESNGTEGLSSDHLERQAADLNRFQRALSVQT
jgi:hypothetical protein